MFYCIELAAKLEIQFILDLFVERTGLSRFDHVALTSTLCR